MAEATFEVFRGDRDGGQPATYRVPIAPGMVVLDALHHIQAHQAPDLAVGTPIVRPRSRPLSKRTSDPKRTDAVPLPHCPIAARPIKASS